MVEEFGCDNSPSSPSTSSTSASASSIPESSSTRNDVISCASEWSDPSARENLTSVGIRQVQGVGVWFAKYLKGQKAPPSSVIWRSSWVERAVESGRLAVQGFCDEAGVPFPEGASVTSEEAADKVFRGEFFLPRLSKSKEGLSSRDLTRRVGLECAPQLLRLFAATTGDATFSGTGKGVADCALLAAAVRDGSARASLVSNPRAPMGPAAEAAGRLLRNGSMIRDIYTAELFSESTSLLLANDRGGQRSRASFFSHSGVDEFLNRGASNSSSSSSSSSPSPAATKEDTAFRVVTPTEPGAASPSYIDRTHGPSGLQGGMGVVLNPKNLLLSRLSPRDEQFITALGRWNWSLGYVTDPACAKDAPLCGGRLLQQIVRDFTDAPPGRVGLYSGHDTTICALLVALRCKEFPPHSWGFACFALLACETTQVVSSTSGAILSSSSSVTLSTCADPFPGARRGYPTDICPKLEEVFSDVSLASLADLANKYVAEIERSAASNTSSAAASETGEKNDESVGLKKPVWSGID